MIRALSVAVLLASATPALAVSDPEPNAVATPAAKPAKPKLICRTIEQIGSRLGGHRECGTAQDWENRARDDRKDFEQRQLQGGGPRSGA